MTEECSPIREERDDSNDNLEIKSKSEGEFEVFLERISSLYCMEHGLTEEVEERLRRASCLACLGDQIRQDHCDPEKLGPVVYSQYRSASMFRFPCSPLRIASNDRAET